MKKVIVSFLLLALAMSLFAYPVRATTQAQIDAAIASGLAYLAGVQNPGPAPPAGSWGWVGGDWEAKTATVLLKFETHAKQQGLDPFDNDTASPTYYQYANNVIAGMNYLLSRAQVVSPLPIQTHGPNLDDPDSNTNGQGIAWLGATHDVYTTGLALSAISESCHPNDRSFVIGGTPYTYKQIAQDAADWLAYAQSDWGVGEGGWAYVALNNSGNATGGWSTMEDNSNSGYAALGLAYAIDFGCTVPQWVKNELNIWIDIMQDDVGVGPVADDGGSWYRPPGPYQWPWVNILKTGNLIFEMALYGDTPAVARVQDAVDYLERHWRKANWSPGWGYSMAVADYQAMFTTMKGLEYMGIDKLDTDGDGFVEDWFNQEPTAVPSEDFASVIVAQQGTGGAPPGAWPVTNWDDPDGIMSTAWALLTLQKAAPPTPPPPAIHLDAEPPHLIDLTRPVCTQWHELYPVFSRRYHLSSWLDANGDGVLGPSDQIDLTLKPWGPTEWYHVDQVTVTIILSKKPDLVDIMYLEFNGTQDEFLALGSPISTVWHEVYPVFSNWYHLSSWEDTDLSGNLTVSDQIDLEPIMSPGPIEWYHVDAVKTDIIATPKPPGIHLDAEPPILIDLEKPVCTQWHELYPDYSRQYHLSFWKDTNDDEKLSPCDQITLWDKDTLEWGWYHVDQVTVTLFVTNKTEVGEPMYIEFEGDIQDFPFWAPVCTQWHEVWPEFCWNYHLQAWEDTNADGVLSPCDQIELHVKETSEKVWFHVDAVKTDIVVTPKSPKILDVEPPILIDLTKPVCTQWHELYPDYSRQYHLSSWVDTCPGDKKLGRCDYIDLTDKETGGVQWYHVEKVTVTIILSKKPDLVDIMYLEFDGTIDEFMALGDPLCTWWHEVWPVFSRWWHILSWADTDGSGTLTVSDQVDFIDGTEWHVDAVKTDIIVTEVTIPADINLDGTVNIIDIVIAATAFGSSPGDSNWDARADVNGDGIVNIFDLVIIAINFGKTAP